MKIGFSFNGVHCGEFGLEYIPNEKDIFPYVPSFKMQEENVTGRHGGYHYGENVDIQTRKLECFFDEMPLQTMEKVLRWVSRGAKGRLIFDNRPYVYYDAVVGAAPSGEAYVRANHNDGQDCYSGKMTIQFSVYDPLGSLLYSTYEHEDIENASRECGIIRSDMLPPSVTPSTGVHLIYNPGTEVSATLITVAGVAPNGITIQNRTTGDVCTLTSLPEEGYSIVLDGESGEVIKMPKIDSDSYAFEFHNEGYITLASCEPYDKEVQISSAAGSNIIASSTYDFKKQDIGRFVWLWGEWVKIINVTDARSAVLSKAAEVTNHGNTMLAVLNDILVDGEDAELTELKIEFIPRVR